MIGRRLILFSIFTVFLTGALVSGLFIRHARFVIQEQMEKRGKILLQAVGKQTLGAIGRGDTDGGLQGVVRSLKQDPDVDAAIITDSDGRIMAHSDPLKKGSRLFLTLWDQQVMKSDVPLVRYDQENARYIIGLAIQGPRSFQEGNLELSLPSGGSTISFGAIYVSLSEAKIRQNTEKTSFFVAVSLAGAVSVACVLVALFTRHIVRPLGDLHRATQELAQGNLNAQVRVAGHDEVAQVADSFNKMTVRLRETTISKNELAAVVEEKTKALKEANRTLLGTNMELKRLAELESTFVSVASHELRTPLTSISGFTSLMLKYGAKLTAEQMTSYLNSIVSETARLSRMINEVLDLKKIQTGSVEMHPVKMDVKSLAEKVVEELRVRPNQPNYQTVFPGPLIVFLDEDKVKQVMINLLSNAAKYTPRDKSVTLEGFLVGDQTLVLNVRDEGPGIPKELWMKLFRPFARASDEVAKKTVGSGLGLAITKSLVETMGGKIRAENLKSGAQFTVILPRGTPAQAAAVKPVGQDAGRKIS
ncbi:MAG: HAMP domain-containing protein [Elusimicrobia bacterium]|nr:HAMP domain-containing protein [Elusimicrobiota bacterium]